MFEQSFFLIQIGKKKIENNHIMFFFPREEPRKHERVFRAATNVLEKFEPQRESRGGAN